jgi:cobalt-zinc-cadmium efflux system protein
MTGSHHDHAHGHDHVHRPAGADAERKILLAMALTGSFMVVEVFGGLLSGSLALIADAGHMATDFASLLLAYAGIRFGKRPADSKRTYGYRRLEVLAAFVNGITLLALTVWIAVEAVQRIAAPVEVLSGPMMAVAVLGLAVNLAAYAILRQGGSDNVNVGGALVHVLGDLLGSLAAIAAAAVIWFTGWMPIDPILSLFVALLIVRSGWQIVRRSAHILLEGTPPGIDVDAIKQDIERIEGVREASHIHVWSLTSERPMATMHIRVAPGADAAAVLLVVKQQLAAEFGIEHSTVEVGWASSVEPGH